MAGASKRAWNPDRVGTREIAFALADCDVVCLRWSQHAAAREKQKDKKRKRKKVRGRMGEKGEASLLQE
jgi:hypothetical protein